MDHADSPASDTGALCDQLAQSHVRLTIDRRRRDVHAQNAIALIHNGIALGTRMQANGEIYVGHQLEYAL